jgi:hypothetical protein
VSPSEIADLLEMSGNTFASILDAVAITPELASWHPVSGEWCINEVVGHVIVTEKNGFAGRIGIILGADEPDLLKYDRDAMQKSRHDCARDPKALRVELLEARTQSLELVASLQSEHLSRGGLHPEVGRLTVDELLHEWVHHDGNHLRQALANVQTYVWPNMGNARRFSQPAKI